MNLKEALVLRQEIYTRTEKALFMVAPKLSDGHADFQKNYQPWDRWIRV